MTSFMLLALMGCPTTTTIPGGGNVDTATGSYSTEDAHWTGGSTGGSGSSDTDDGGEDTDGGSGSRRTWYADCDGDSYGATSFTRISSTMPSGDSCDGGGYWVLVGGDCSDANAGAFPGNTEVSDGVDNDCDGTIDESASSANTWYYDADGDGFGLSSVTSSASAMPSGYASVGGDCDDSNASAYPGGSEGSSIDGVDQDCDGTPDDGISSGDLETWYADCDCDGWGADDFTRESDGEPDGDSCSAGGCWSLEGGDCEDSNSSLNPDDGCDEEGCTEYEYYFEFEPDGPFDDEESTWFGGEGYNPATTEVFLSWDIWEDNSPTGMDVDYNGDTISVTYTACVVEGDYWYLTVGYEEDGDELYSCMGANTETGTFRIERDNVEITSGSCASNGLGGSEFMVRAY